MPSSLLLLVVSVERYEERRVNSSLLEYDSVTDSLQRRIRDNGDKSLSSLCIVLLSLSDAL